MSSVTVNRSHTTRTEYAGPRVLIVRELAKTSKVTVFHVPTGAMVADVGTTGLPSNKSRSITQQIKDFSRCTKWLGVFRISVCIIPEGTCGAGTAHEIKENIMIRLYYCSLNDVSDYTSTGGTP